MFFCDEAKAHQDLAWLNNHNGKMREYMLVADTTPTKPVRRVTMDQLDDQIPW